MKRKEAKKYINIIFKNKNNLELLKYRSFINNAHCTDTLRTPFFGSTKDSHQMYMTIMHLRTETSPTIFPQRETQIHTHTHLLEIKGYSGKKMEPGVRRPEF